MTPSADDTNAAAAAAAADDAAVRARRLLLRADDGQEPLLDVTDPDAPQPVDLHSLVLSEDIRTRLADWSGRVDADRDLPWQVAGAGLASAVEDELGEGVEIRYANGRDDPLAPGPTRPPGGGRTYVLFATPVGPDGPPAYSSSLSLTFGAPPAQPPRVLATDQDDAALAEFRRRIVEPVARSLLTDAEYRSTRVYRQSDEPDGVRVDVLADGDGYLGGWLVWPGLIGWEPTVEDIAQKFASDLEDWVCESRFAWGQQRRAVFTIPPPA